MDKKPAGEPIPIPTSTQKSLSSSHDSGWNDPPKWAYSQSPNSSTTPTKRVLNKRVAFPLGSTPPTSNFDPNQPLTPPPANMPPPPLTAVRLTAAPSPQFKGGVGEEENSKDLMPVSKEQAIIDSLDNFESVINENEELKSKREDVRRRLNLMKTAWAEDKLDESIRRKVFELSKALKDKDVETADKIHVSLMMDHAALCSSWIPGIRHMILALRGKQAQENRPAEETTSPYLLPFTDLKETK